MTVVLMLTVPAGLTQLGVPSAMRSSTIHQTFGVLPAAAFIVSCVMS